MRVLFCFALLIFSSISANAQNLEGSYEQVLENHSKELITLRKVNSFEETEYRWYDGKWVLKCTYIGKWSVVGDTLVLKPIRVIWADKDITVCRDQDDNKQPGCCFSYKYFYDDKSIWIYGALSKSKYVYLRR